MPELSPDELNYLLRLARADLKLKEETARNDYSRKLLLTFRKKLVSKLENLVH